MAGYPYPAPGPLVAPPPPRPRSHRRLAITLVVGALVLVLVVAGVLGYQAWARRAAIPPSASSDRTGLVVFPGRAGSAVPQVVIYLSYKCPFCQRLEQVFGPKLHAAAGAGRIRLEYRIVSLGSSEDLAVIGATCADHVGLFLAYHDQVFAQPSVPTSQVLRERIPTAVGLSGDRLDRFQKCFDAKTTLAFVKGMDSAARSAGVDAVPSVRVNDATITRKLDYDNPDSIDPFLKG